MLCNNNFVFIGEKSLKKDNNEKIFENNDLYFNINNKNTVELNYNNYEFFCSVCNKNTLSQETKMKNIPPFIFVERFAGD